MFLAGRTTVREEDMTMWWNLAVFALIGLLAGGAARFIAVDDIDIETVIDQSRNTLHQIRI